MCEPHLPCRGNPTSSQTLPPALSRPVLPVSTLPCPVPPCPALAPSLAMLTQLSTVAPLYLSGSWHVCPSLVSMGWSDDFSVSLTGALSVAFRGRQALKYVWPCASANCRTQGRGRTGG